MIYTRLSSADSGKPSLNCRKCFRHKGEQFSWRTCWLAMGMCREHLLRTRIPFISLGIPSCAEVLAQLSLGTSFTPMRHRTGRRRLAVICLTPTRIGPAVEDGEQMAPGAPCTRSLDRVHGVWCRGRALIRHRMQVSSTWVKLGWLPEEMDVFKRERTHSLDQR